MNAKNNGWMKNVALIVVVNYCDFTCAHFLITFVLLIITFIQSSHWKYESFNSDCQGRLFCCFPPEAAFGEKKSLLTVNFVLCTPAKVPCTALSLIWAGEEEANMAAKAGDNPDSLMTLATVFCLRNLRKTMCYQGFRNKLCLRSDIFLPSEICDKLVNTYVTGYISWCLPNFWIFNLSKWLMFVTVL